MLNENTENTIGNYFRSNLLRVRAAVDPTDFAKFAGLSSNPARVNFVLNYPEAHLLPLQVENARAKDLKKALETKRMGNEYYAAGDYARALENYSNAILVAPRNELAVFLANRSAVLHATGRHDLALADIEEALEIGYPKELLYKIEERRAKCWLALENHPRAIEAFRRTLSALDEAKIPLERRKKIESDVRIMLALMEKVSRRDDDATDSGKRTAYGAAAARKTIVAPRLADENALYPACSRSVDIRDGGPVVGRHAVATRDIRPGELLAVEKPHSAVLLGEYRRTHCQNCFSRVVAPYPAACDLCDLVVYCSATCRNFHAKVHESECDLLAPLWLSRASITCLIALRAITQRPFSHLQAAKRDIEKDDYRVSGPYKSDDYAAFHALVTHEKEREAEDLFHRAYMAAWLLRLLKTTNYFPTPVKTPDLGGQNLSEEECFVGGLLLRHLQLLAFNTHEISELTRARGDKSLSSAKSVFIGGGVYPTVALFNHSCNPGIIRYFVGTTMIVRAARTITAGSEICENYGPIFTTCDENERKRCLRTRYWFDCACEACRGHWPLLDQLDPRILRFKCETGVSCGNVLPISTDSDQFVITCPKCGKSTNIFKALKALQDTDGLSRAASRHLDNARWDLALEAYVKVLRLMDETLALPLRDYHICQEGLRLCILAHGNSSLL